MLAFRRALLSRSLALWIGQRFGLPSHGTVDAQHLSKATPFLLKRHFLPYVSSILPSWASNSALDRALKLVRTVKGWNKLVLASAVNISGDQALIFLSELGDLTETAANSERSNGQNIWVDVQDGDTTEHLDRALTFLVQRLKQHTAPVKGSGTSSLDPTLLGAGLKTSWQLQLPAVEDLKTQEILKRHSKEIREALLNEGAAAVRRLFDGYEPDQGWKQPIQPEGFDTLANLITGLASVADPKCRVETLLARAVSNHGPDALAPMPADLRALVLRAPLDAHIVKGCVSPDLEQVLRSEPFWRGVYTAVGASASGMSTAALLALLEKFAIVQRLKPEVRQPLAAALMDKVRQGVGRDGGAGEAASDKEVAARVAGQDADAVILMHLAGGSGQAEAASVAGSAMLKCVRSEAEQVWGGREFRSALQSALQRNAGFGATGRPGVWAVCAMVDELATAMAGELAGEDVYSIDAMFDELRYKKSRLMEEYLVRHMKGKRAV